jgi:hypothetical protein
MSRPKARPSSFAPSLEVLEGRECPAGISLNNGVLTVSGTAGRDTVTITQNDDPAVNEVVVEDGRQLIVFRANHVSVVNVGLDAGDDLFTYQLASDYQYPKHITVWLGYDSDDAFFHFGGATPYTLEDNLYLSVAGMAGDDEVYADFGDFLSTSAAPRLDMDLDLGNGIDTAVVDLNGRVGPNGIAQFDLLGNSHTDTITFNQAGAVDATALLDVVMDGGFGNDVIDLNVAAELDGTCQYRVDGGIRGDDTVTGTVTAAAGSEGSLDVACYGGTGIDHMGLEVFDNSGGTFTLTQALLDGGTGADVPLDITYDTVTVVNM